MTGHTRRDALIVDRKGLVLMRFCGVWMTGSQMEWNIWMGRSAHTGCGEAHTRRPHYSRMHHHRAASHKVSPCNPGARWHTMSQVVRARDRGRVGAL